MITKNNIGNATTRSLTTIEIVRESPPGITIATWVNAVAYAGTEVWVLSTACDVWAGSDKLGAWREMIPRWRHITLMHAGTLVFSSNVTSYICYAAGSVVETPPFGDIGGVTPPGLFPSIAGPLPPSLAGGYIKIGRYSMDGVDHPVPSPLWRAGNIDLTACTTAVQTTNPFLNGGMTAVPGLVRAAPTRAAYPINGNGIALNQNFATTTGSIAFAMWPMFRSGWNTLSLPFNISIAGRMAGAFNSSPYIVIAAGVIAGAPAAANLLNFFNAPGTTFANSLTKALLIPVPAIPGSNTGSQPLFFFTEMEVFLPNWVFEGAENGLGYVPIQMTTSVSPTSAWTVATNYAATPTFFALPAPATGVRAVSLQMAP